MKVMILDGGAVVTHSLNDTSSKPNVSELENRLNTHGGWIFILNEVAMLGSSGHLISLQDSSQRTFSFKYRLSYIFIFTSRNLVISVIAFTHFIPASMDS